MAFELWLLGYSVVEIGKHLGITPQAVHNWVRRYKWEARLQTCGITRPDLSDCGASITQTAELIERRLLSGDVELATLFVPTFGDVVRELEDWSKNVLTDLMRRYDEAAARANEAMQLNPNAIDFAIDFDASAAAKILKLAKAAGITPGGAPPASSPKSLMLDVDL